jgi:hypothetical protein
MQEIPLTRGRVALVDDDDYEWLMGWKWQWQAPNKGSVAGHTGYACHSQWMGGGKVGRFLIHRVIMQPPPGMEVDHIRPGDGLDNRRCNLRIVDHAANCRNRSRQKNNTSGIVGVWYDTYMQKWDAKVSIEGKQKRIGRYATKEEAATAIAQARERLGY